MRIGILLVGRASEDLINQYGTYAEMLVALINSEEKIFEFKTFNILDDEFPEDHLECDGWIITGSPHGVYEELPWMKTISQLINDIYNAALKNVENSTPLGLAVTPEQVADVIYNFIDISKTVTGETFLVDGGYHLTI